MKWTGISGSRQTNIKVEKDVRREINKILKRGDGVVVGGAMGVDYFAADEVMRQRLAKDRLKIFLPASLNLHLDYYRNKANESLSFQEELQRLILQLETIKNGNALNLFENMSSTEANVETFFERNGKIVEASDELLAFQVNASPGTQNTIEHARIKGIPVKIFTYKI